MSTVIYLANQQVQAVVGTTGTKKISVQKTYSAEAPEGSIINGMIMDQELFQGFLKDFWMGNKLPTKDVILVINSSKFVGKKIELPKLNDAKSMEFIEREFADIRKSDDDIYGYISLTNKDAKTKRIYAESISSGFIKDYIDIFSSIGVTLKSVYSGESTLINFTEITVGSRYKTFVLLIADHMTLTTVLWVDGEFYYFNTVRCFHEQGTEDYAIDIARSVSQIFQFMQANQIEHSLEIVQLAGMNYVDIGLYQNALAQQGLNYPIEKFNGTAISANGQDIQEHIYAASGLVVNDKTQNFLVKYNSNKKKGGKVSGNFAKGLWAIVITFVVLLLTTSGMFFAKLMKQNQLNKVKDERMSPVRIEQLVEYQELTNRTNFLQKQYAAIYDINENIYTYPTCDEDILKIFERCSGNYATVEFESFDADEGIARVTAMSETVDDINKFIKALMEEDVFSDVNYTGYNYNEQKECWDINVICTLAESAGRDD